MKNLKLFLLSLFIVVFLGACGTAKKPVEPEPASSSDVAESKEVVEVEEEAEVEVEVEEQGRCDLGRKSGGVTLATEMECQEMGGTFLE